MTPTVRFQREALTESLWDEALPLLVSHWTECGHTEPLRPSLTKYGQLEANGVLRVFTARESTGKLFAAERLLGYGMFTIMPSLNTGILEAQQAAIYVSDDQRGAHGSAFIDFCTDALFAEGVELVYQIDTVARPLGALLARKGFECKGVVWAKQNPQTVTLSTGDAALDADPAVKEWLNETALMVRTMALRV